jgi:hypothetical protein
MVVDGFLTVLGEKFLIASLILKILLAAYRKPPMNLKIFRKPLMTCTPDKIRPAVLQARVQITARTPGRFFPLRETLYLYSSSTRQHKNIKYKNHIRMH